MWPSIWFILIVTIVVTLVAYARSPELPLEGLKGSGRLFLQIFPILLLALVLAGMIEVALPKTLVPRLFGQEAGFRGVLLGTVAGSLTPGGPMVAIPLMVSLAKSGAGSAAMVSYFTAWGLLGLNRMLLFEIPLLGWRFTALRVSACALLPIVAGLIARTIERTVSST